MLLSNTFIVVVDVADCQLQFGGYMGYSYRRNKAKTRCNERIYSAAEEYGLYHWQIADLLGMREDTFSKKLRYELPEEEQDLIIATIRSYRKEYSE